eukprot:scaffold2140_cov394-Prasinococcus_capsulatus_cf.AAC.18
MYDYKNGYHVRSLVQQNSILRRLRARRSFRDGHHVCRVISIDFTPLWTQGGCGSLPRSRATGRLTGRRSQRQ